MQSAAKTQERTRLSVSLPDKAVLGSFPPAGPHLMHVPFQGTLKPCPWFLLFQKRLLILSHPQGLISFLWSSDSQPSLILRSFNIVLHVVLTLNRKIISSLFHSFNLATVKNRSVNIRHTRYLLVKPKGRDPQVENHISAASYPIWDAPSRQVNTGRLPSAPFCSQQALFRSLNEQVFSFLLAEYLQAKWLI